MNCPEFPATFSSPSPKARPGQIAHVLPPDAEVGVDVGFGESLPDALDPGRSRGTVRVRPSVKVGPCRWRREVRRDRQRT